jgi:hypothetical protein
MLPSLKNSHLTLGLAEGSKKGVTIESPEDTDAASTGE